MHSQQYRHSAACLLRYFSNLKTLQGSLVKDEDKNGRKTSVGETFPMGCLMPEAGSRENWADVGCKCQVDSMYGILSVHYVIVTGGEKWEAEKRLFERRFEIFTTASGREHRAVVGFSWKNSQTTNQDIHLSDETTIMQREREREGEEEEGMCVCVWE